MILEWSNPKIVKINTLKISQKKVKNNPIYNYQLDSYHTTLILSHMFKPDVTIKQTDVRDNLA